MRFAAVLAALFLFAACSGSATDDTASAPTSAPAAPEATAQPTEPPATNCTAVDEILAQSIIEGLKHTNTRLSDFQGVLDGQVLWVSAVMTYTDMAGDDTATFAIGSQGSGLILSADAFARDFTDWPDARQVNDSLVFTEPRAQESRACAEASFKAAN